MPDNSANRAQLRLDGHKVKAYAAFFTGASVLTGVVSATPATTAYPITSLAYTTSTGSSANVRRGYRVVIKTAAGEFKFATTVRASGTISSTALPIRESSRGTVRVVSGDLIEVRSIMQPGDKLVEATAAFNPDGVSYSNQNSVIAPVCCSGGPWAGPLDAGQAYATVPFVGSTAYTLDPASSGAITHSWTAATATGTTTSTSADPSFTFPLGEHLVVHVITDTTNSATATQIVAVKVCDETTWYDILLDAPPDINIQSGASCTLELFADAALGTTLDDIPDGTLCVVFMLYTIGGVQVSYGSMTAGRHHILMTGYTNGDSFAYRDGLDTLRMDIVSPLAWYAATLGLSKVGLRDSTPSNWGEIKGLTCWIMAMQIARWYTWMTESWDILKHTYLTDEDFPAFFITEQDAIAQIREIVSGLRGRFICLRHGTMQAQPRIELMTRAHRLLQPVTLVHGDPDILEYEFVRDHRRRVGRVRTQALRAATTVASSKPLFAVYPGDAPGDGVVSDTIEKLILFSASGHYEVNGRLGADADRVFVKKDASDNVVGVYHAPSGTLVVPGYFIYDLYCERQQFDASMDTNLRGVDLSLFDWIIESITYEIDEKGVPTTNLQIKAETDGDPGVDDTPPAEETNNLPPYTPPVFDFVIDPAPILPVVDGGLRLGTGVIAVFINDNTLAITTDFDTLESAGGPSWLVLDLTALTNWGGGTLVDFAVDAFSPGYPGGGSTPGGAINGWICTTTQVQRITDIFGSPALTTAVTLPGTTNARQMNFERGVQNWGLIISYVPAAGMRASYTTNGTSWADVNITNHYDTGTGVDWNSGLAMLPAVAGKAYASAFTSTGAAPTADGYVTTDYGATWSAISSPNIEPGTFPAGSIVVPYPDSAGATAYYGNRSGSSASVLRTLVRRTGTGSEVGISPTHSGDVYGVDNNRGNRVMAIPESDPDTLCGVFVTSNTGAATLKIGVFVTHNASAAAPTWIVAITPDIGSVMLYRAVYALDKYHFIPIGGAGAIALMTLDAAGNVSVDSRTGNLVTAATIVGICGGGA